MNSSIKRPILYRGEVYSSPIEKRTIGQQKEPNITFEESRSRILQNIGDLMDVIKATPQNFKLPHENIVCFRVQEEFAAKSYYPEALFGPSYNLVEIGSRMWKKKFNDEISKTGRLFFVRASESTLSNLEKKLNEKESSLYNNFKLDIRKIEEVNLLSSDEQILGFNDDWQSGRIEAVLHPFNLDRAVAISHFTELVRNAGGDVNSLRTKQYEGDGLTYISLLGDLNILKSFSGYNPLRTAHPLKFRSIPEFTRGSSIIGCPKPPVYTKRSSIVVGVLDGGYKKGNPSLDNYVESIDAVSGDPVPFFEEHGTNVTSAVLYGPLNNYADSDILPEPAVTVKNFRVLSQDVSSDPDLYNVIDAIENVVPQNTNIQVYNLSIGPIGPILDDYVSRFTYAIDTLSKKHNVLFNVAVGNDGDKIHYDRIQSPSDMVNGMAIASYTINDGKVERATYSCKGPGREGNKMKPDISAFGGCSRNPIQLISFEENRRIYTQGTSFSAPQVSGLSGKLIGSSKGVINALTARLLLIHGAERTSNDGHCDEMGHGIMQKDIDTLMTCINNSYTLIYEGEIQHGKFHEFEIPWVNEISRGKVNFKWTVAVQSSVDENSPEDYTTSSIQINFYPDSNKYLFVHEETKKTKRINILTEAETVKQLEKDGWKQSGTPVSESSENPFTSENSLRNDDLKWDTIDLREVQKMTNSIYDPRFQVHAIGRGKRNNDSKVKFAIALTVEILDETIDTDIYQKIRNKYDALLPINMEIQVPVTV